jgi:hypothetical protein
MNSRDKFSWTDEAIERLKKLHGEGLSGSEIAARFGISRNAIIGKMHRVGLRSASPEKQARHVVARRSAPGLAHAEVIKAKAAEGIPDVKIGEDLSLTASQVRWARRQLKIPSNAGGNRGNAASFKQRSIVPAETLNLALELRFREGQLGQVARCDLFTIRDGLCRYPLDRADGSVGYCGDTVEEGGSYCAAHAARCYNGIPQPKPQLVMRSYVKAA